MLFSTLVSSFALFAATGLAGYVLEDDYFATDFFDQFTFMDAPDPTHGFVEYQSRDNARSSNLISNTQENAQMRVNNSTTTPQGRPSVRITSNKSYSSGLVIVDIEHMPASICGTWPAFWMVGPNWPNGGEIDILEGVNDQTGNDMTLHTGPGCSVSNTGGFSGTMKSTTCASSYNDNDGCQIASSESNTYGTGFNSNGGGVYAMEWTSSYISVHFFPRNSIPNNIYQNPDPSSWGMPMAKFSGDCDMSSAFVDQQIVFDTTFCGDWAGQVWGNSCAASTGKTCEAYVQDNPEAFTEAYWSINGLKVFQNNGDSTPAPSTQVATSVSTQYITQPAAQTSYVAPTVTPTTFVIATSSVAPFVPIVGPSGSVGVGSSPAESGTGYAPVVGGDGTIAGAAWSAPAPVETAAEGSWSTASDGGLSYVGSRRDEEEERQGRMAKHLRFHKRHGAKF